MKKTKRKARPNQKVKQRRRKGRDSDHYLRAVGATGRGHSYYVPPGTPDMVIVGANPGFADYKTMAFNHLCPPIVFPTDK